MRAGVDVAAEAGEPGRREDDHRLVPRHAAADEAGVAALRDDGHAGVGAQPQGPGDLLGRSRPHDEQRLAAEPSRPIAGE